MDFDGLLGLIIAALLYGLPALLGAAKRKRERRDAQAGARPETASVPPAAPVPAAARAKQRGRSTVEALERAGALESQAPHPQLGTVLHESLEEARSLERRLDRAEEAGTADLRRQLKGLHERAAFLLRLVEDRADPEVGPLVRGLADAVERAVPRLTRRPLVMRGGEHERGSPRLAGTPLLPLVLTGRPDRRPWTVAALVEDAWAAELLGEAKAIDALTERAARMSAGDDAIGRFASALGQAWAPALYLDAACTLSLADGHLARVRALIDEAGPDELFVVRLDASQRVDGVPPAGLRLMLLRRLLASLGGPAAPPLPPDPVLHLRGPGVWDQAPLAPVLDHAASLQGAFAEELSERPGLQHSLGVGEQARLLLEQAANDQLPRSPEARALFAAAGLSAVDPGEPDRTKRLLGCLSDSSVAAAVRTGPERRRSRSRPRRRPSSRKRVLREAVLLGAAFGGRNPS